MREGGIHNAVNLPMEHSSMSWLQAPPTKPAGQVQMARPFKGLVSHTAPSLQGLLTQASSRWQSRPAVTAECDSEHNGQNLKIRSDVEVSRTSFAHRALAEKGGHTVMTCGPVEADSSSTVVNVLTAVVSSPAIDTYTGVSSDSVKACTTIVTSIGLHETLVDILSTILA